MKKRIFPFLLLMCLLFAVCTVSALAAPTDGGNVGDSDGVVTSGDDGGLLPEVTLTTAPTTTLPVSGAATTTAAITTTGILTTAPTTTADIADDGEDSGVFGIVLAAIIAAAVIVLTVLLLPKLRDRRNGK